MNEIKCCGAKWRFEGTAFRCGVCNTLHELDKEEQ